MGYTLYGFVAKRGTFDSFSALDRRISIAKLNTGFDLLLNDQYLNLGLQISNSQIAKGFEDWNISYELMEVMSDLSKQTPIAYIISECFGGLCDEWAMVWTDGKIIMKQDMEDLSAASISIVNTALKLIGVEKESDQYEFTRLGLGRNRFMSYWFEECTGISSKEYLKDLKS